MGKKVQCRNCENGMRFALPEKVNANNLEYAEGCLYVAKKTLVCGWTMKAKGMEHEQYCKNYRKKSDEMIRFDVENAKVQISNLKKMIMDFKANA